MTRRFTLLTIFCLALLSVFADEIITTTAESITCTVTEVKDETVKYRKNGESFERELSRSQIFKIKYANGEEELQPTTSSPKASRPAYGPPPAAQEITLTSTPHDFSDLPPASRSYTVGEWFDENGLQGVVVAVTSDGLHGLLMHPKRIGAKALAYSFGAFMGNRLIPTGMNDRANGYANYLTLLRFLQEHPEISVSDFQLQAEISKLGEGWYVPALDEVSTLIDMYNTEVPAYQGAVKKFHGKKAKIGKIINHTLKLHGGDKFNPESSCLMTSTEKWSRGGASPTFNTFYGDPDTPQYVIIKVETVGKQQKFLDLCRDFRGYGTRAFHRF